MELTRRLLLFAAAVATAATACLFHATPSLADVTGVDLVQFAQVSNPGTAEPCKEFVAPLDGLGGCTMAVTCSESDCLGSSTVVVTEPNGEQVTLNLFATQPNPFGGWADYQVTGSGVDDGARVNVEGTMSYAALGCAGCPWLTGYLAWYGV